MLVVDYALKPVLSALKAQEMLQGIFAEDSQIAYGEGSAQAQLAPALEQRLHKRWISLSVPWLAGRNRWSRAC